MKKIMMMLVVVLMSGCTPQTTQNNSFILPQELSDCKVYDLYNGYRNLTVIRCPKSEESEVCTTVKSGKATHYSCTLSESER